MQPSHGQHLSFVVKWFAVIINLLEALEHKHEHQAGGSNRSSRGSLARLLVASRVRSASVNSSDVHARSVPWLRTHFLARVPHSVALSGQNSKLGLVVPRADIAKKAPSLLPAYDKVCNNKSELKSINSFFNQLLNFTNYDHDKIRRALEVAFIAHHGQLRKSGDLFVSHPVEAAAILCQGGFDLDCVLAGLLHDTVEDTVLSFTEIQNLFNVSVRNIVEGETEASKLADKAWLPTTRTFDPQNEEAENLRSLFVAIAKDFRVIVVKLADRLHNMRTLEFMPPRKQVIKARETLELYVPLAERFGLWYFKSELSDLAFKYIYPLNDTAIGQYLHKNRETHDSTIKAARIRLERIFEGDTLLRGRVHISHRIKGKYSIFKKMQRNSCGIDDINDIVAMRVVLKQNTRRWNSSRGGWMTNRLELEDKALCYLILSRLHSIHEPLNGTFKDYIQSPKDNGYKSLHTTIKIKGQPIELQIRTTRMHELAEYGAAAHANYKDSSMSETWKKNIQKFKLNETSRFVENMVEDLQSKTVIVSFLGKYEEFPKGATVRSLREKHGFGNSTHAVVVNGKVEKDSKSLRNNDVIKCHRYEDLPFHKSEPSEDSLQFVVFGRDRFGLVKDIWQIIQQENATIIDLAPEVLRPEAGAPASIDITVEHDPDKLLELMNAVEEVHGVCAVRRGSSEKFLKESREEYWTNCK